MYKLGAPVGGHAPGGELRACDVIARRGGRHRKLLPLGQEAPGLGRPRGGGLKIFLFNF